MGKRVHVASKYEVEYGNTECFNYADDKFIGVLNALGGSVNGFGTDDEATAGGFECPADDYFDALENLKVYISNPTLFQESEDIRKHLEELGMTAEKLLKVMQAYYDEADKRDGYLHFASW